MPEAERSDGPVNDTDFKKFWLATPLAKYVTAPHISKKFR